MEKVKKQVNDTYKATKTVVTNAEELVIALSLLVSTFYNYYDLSIREVGKVEYTVRLAAVVITSFVGFYLLVRHFNKQGKK
jgi:hypothetical protein